MLTNVRILHFGNEYEPLYIWVSSISRYTLNLKPLFPWSNFIEECIKLYPHLSLVHTLRGYLWFLRSLVGFLGLGRIDVWSQSRMRQNGSDSTNHRDRGKNGSSLRWKRRRGKRCRTSSASSKNKVSNQTSLSLLCLQYLLWPVSAWLVVPTSGASGVGGQWV